MLLDSGAIGATNVDPCLGMRPAVLVVEDEALVRDMVAETLEDDGFRVRTAANGAEALALLRSPERIGLLFTDIDMPGGMDVYALAREARTFRPDLRVVYTSGARRAPDHRGTVEGSVFVPKPYRLAQLSRFLSPLVTA